MYKYQLWIAASPDIWQARCPKHSDTNTDHSDTNTKTRTTNHNDNTHSNNNTHTNTNTNTLAASPSGKRLEEWGFEQASYTKHPETSSCTLVVGCTRGLPVGMNARSKTQYCRARHGTGHAKCSAMSEAQ